MKPLLPVLALLFISFSSLAQTQTVPVFCRLQDDGQVEYGNLRSNLTGLIPDSARDAMLIDPYRQYRIYNPIDALQLMSLGGWKPVSFNMAPVRPAAERISSDSFCLLTREIELDEKGKAIFRGRLINGYK